MILEFTKKLTTFPIHGRVGGQMGGGTFSPRGWKIFPGGKIFH